jgi:hypothetical protein
MKQTPDVLHYHDSVVCRRQGYTKCANSAAKWSGSVKTLANTDYAVGPAGCV